MGGTNVKLLVLSDTHGYLENARNVLERIGQRMDGVLHLGDHAYDARDLQSEYQTLPFYFVKGNNDFADKAPNDVILKFFGKKLLLTHGHKQQVYWSHDTISYWAEEKGADVVIFGHTHSPVNEHKGSVMIFNPGSISVPRGVPNPTFGILEITEQGLIYGSIMEYIDAQTFLRKK